MWANIIAISLFAVVSSDSSFESLFFNTQLNHNSLSFVSNRF